MRKVESTRTLCDYYNEIVYKVNQLTEMCGNTPEAIKLRDDIYDMFTRKFSEPLDDVSELQEEFDCPIDVVLKIRFGDIHFVYDENSDKFFIHGGEIFKSQFSAYRRIYHSETDFDFIDKVFKWEDHGKTWWTKEDRSE